MDGESDQSFSSFLEPCISLARALSSGTIVAIRKNIFITFFIDLNMIYSPELSFSS